MILTHLSTKEKQCFCSLLLAAVSEDARITEGEIDCLIRYRIELDVADISNELCYEEAVTWLDKNSSDRTKRSILLELTALLYNDNIITGEESELLRDLSRRFEITNLKDFIETGKQLGTAYNSSYKLFKDLM